MALGLADNVMECDPGPIALNYAAPDPRKGRFPLLLAMLFLSLPGVAVPLLSFVYNTSPLSTIWDDGRLWPFHNSLDGLGLLGSTFFVAPAVVAWRAILIATQPRKSFYWIAGPFTVLAYVPIGIVTVLVSHEFFRDLFAADHREWLHGLLALWPIWLIAAGFIGCLLLIVWQARLGERAGALNTALVTPFVANAIYCLLAFRPAEAQPGYWVTSYLVILWSGEIIWTTIRRTANRFHRARRP